VPLAARVARFRSAATTATAAARTPRTRFVAFRFAWRAFAFGAFQRQIVGWFVRRVAILVAFHWRTFNSIAMSAARIRSPSFDSVALPGGPVASWFIALAAPMVAARPAFVISIVGLASFGSQRRWCLFGLRNVFDDFLRLLLGRPKDLMPQAHTRAFWNGRLFGRWRWRGNPFARWSFVDLLMVPSRGRFGRAGRTWRRRSLLWRSRGRRPERGRFSLRSPRWFHGLRRGRHFDPQILCQAVPIAGCRLRQRRRCWFDARLASRWRGLWGILLFGGRCGSGS
jgi:hypothetical protein